MIVSANQERNSPLVLHYEVKRVNNITPMGSEVELFGQHLIARDKNGNPYVVGRLVDIKRRGSLIKGIEYHFLQTEMPIEGLLAVDSHFNTGETDYR
jgi:hypothetical protein